jgi:hypothetical protein
MRLTWIQGKTPCSPLSVNRGLEKHIASIFRVEKNKLSKKPARKQVASNLLLVLASTVILGHGSRRYPWPNCYSFQGHVCVLKWPPQGSHLPSCQAGFLLRLFFRPWRWRRYVPPKRRLTLNGLQGDISQKMVLFITSAVRSSTPTLSILPVVPPWRDAISPISATRVGSWLPMDWGLVRLLLLLL